MAKILPVNDSQTIPGTVVVVEVATVARQDECYADRWQHTFRVAYATAARLEDGKWTREKSTLLTDSKSFWSWLNFVRRTGSPVWLFASCVSQTATLLGIWDLLTLGEFVLNRGPSPNLSKAKSHKARAAMMRTTKGLLITGGPPTAVVCFHRSRWKLTILDLANYLDRTPSQLAEFVNLSHVHWPTPQSSLEEWQSVVQARCNVSTQIVKRLIEWHAKQELGMFPLTASGIAMNSFRHRFMRERIELPEDQDERDFQRTAYFNGRVEALWAGRISANAYTPVRHIPRSGNLFDEHPRGPFHLVDSRSFYGAISAFEMLPRATTETHIDGSGCAPDNGPSLVEVMASVYLDTPNDSYPVRTSTGTVWARGKFWTTLCGTELMRAVGRGHVKRFGGWQRFDLQPVLQQYAQSLWKERMRAEASDDKVISSLCKTLMATLHGKFLQRQPKWSMLPGRVPPGPWQTWSEKILNERRELKFRSVGWDVQIRDDGGDHKYCFPALAAWVTMHGREWLRNWCRAAGDKHVYYVACDALVVDDIGLANLRNRGMIDTGEIGGLRLVRSSDTLEVRGPNNYTHGEHNVVSGRSHRNLQIKGKTWIAERWQGLEEIFCDQTRDEIRSFQVTGNVANFTAPGTVGPGGWITPPYLLTQEESCQRKVQLQLD